MGNKQFIKLIFRICKSVLYKYHLNLNLAREVGEGQNLWRNPSHGVWLKVTDWCENIPHLQPPTPTHTLPPPTSNQVNEYI